MQLLNFRPTGGDERLAAALSVTAFCRCCDPCCCGSLRASGRDPFTLWVQWLLNLLETSLSNTLFYSFIHLLKKKETHQSIWRRKMYEQIIKHATFFYFNIYPQYIYYVFFFLLFVVVFLNKLFCQQDFPCLGVNYAHSSLTYLMAGLSRGPTRRNWKVCHH